MKTFIEYIKKFFKSILLLCYYFGIITLIVVGTYGGFLGCGMSPKCEMAGAMLLVILFFTCPWIVVLILSLKYRKNKTVLLSVFPPIILFLLFLTFLTILDMKAPLISGIILTSIPFLIILSQIFLIKKQKLNNEKN